MPAVTDNRSMYVPWRSSYLSAIGTAIGRLDVGR